MRNGIMQQIDIDVKFDEWFYENEGFALRSERFYDSLTMFKTTEALASNLILWLEAAYMHGVVTAAQDSSDTLLDYATALAGCPPEQKTHTESYDEAARNLIQYWDGVLKEYKRE